jgi:AraC-like DNA-binding protein
MVATWSLAPIRFSAEERIAAHSVTIPLAALGLPHLFLRELLVRDLNASPLGPMVARHLADLAALPSLPEEQAATLAMPTIDLVRALLATAAGNERLGREPLRRSLATRVMLHLRNHVCDPRLDAQLVAAHFGISRRYLYAVLADVDVTLGDWIRTERLERAARQLENPANAMASVATIAQQCGWVDHSSFSRAFRRHFGCTPTTWRLTHGQPTTTVRSHQGRLAAG